MQVITFSNFKKFLLKVNEDADKIIVTRKNNKFLVMMPFKKYNSLMEIAHLLSTENNRRELEK